MRFIAVFLVLFFLAYGTSAQCKRGVDLVFPVDLNQAQLDSLSRADGGQNFLIVPGTDGNGNLNAHLANVVINAGKVKAFREIGVSFSPLASGGAPSMKEQFSRLLAEIDGKRLPIGRIWISVTEGRANWPQDPAKNRQALLEVLDFMEKKLGSADRVGIHTAAFYFNKIVGPASGFSKYKLWYLDTDEKEAITPKSPLNGAFADYKQDEGYMKQFKLKVNVGGIEVNKNFRDGKNSVCFEVAAGAAAPGSAGPSGPSGPGKFRQLKRKVAAAAAMLETKGVFMDNSDNRVVMQAQDAKVVAPPARTLEPGLKVEGNWVYVNTNNEQPQQQQQQQQAAPRFAQAQVEAQAESQAQVSVEAQVAAEAQAQAAAIAKVEADAKAMAEAHAAAQAQATTQAQVSAQTQATAAAKAQAQAAAQTFAAAQAKAQAEAQAKAKAEAAAQASALAKIQAQAKAEAVAQARAEAQAAAAMRTLLNLEAEIGQELVAEIDHESLVNSVADRDLDYNQMGSLLYDDDLAPVPASNIKSQPAAVQHSVPVAAGRSMLESAAQSTTETEVDVDAEAETEAEADPLAGDMDAKNALHLLTELDLEDIKQN